MDWSRSCDFFFLPHITVTIKFLDGHLLHSRWGHRISDNEHDERDKGESLNHKVILEWLKRSLCPVAIPDYDSVAVSCHNIPCSS